MVPQPDRSASIVARVVAWHNRHPLALRITAAEVQSVGVVSLPYAVEGAVVAPLPAAEALQAAVAAVADAGSTPDALAAAPLDDAGAEVELVTEPQEPEVAVATGATAQAQPAAPEVAVATGATAQAQPAAPDGVDPAITAAPAADVAADAALANRLAASASASAPPAPDAAPPAPTTPVRLLRQVRLPPRSTGRRWWRRWLDRRAFRALFTEDFIAPLHPRRVAAWVADHGSPEWPLEPESPMRLVELDAKRRDPDSLAPELDLHVITAAIVVGDRRRRLLLAPGADGAILGRRHIGRARVALASGPLVLGLVAAVAVVMIGRGDAAGVTPGQAPALAAASAAPAASAPAEPPVRVAPAEQAPPQPVPQALARADALPASAPADAQPSRGRIELPPLVPRLADGERQALRLAAQDLRGPGPQAAPTKAYALATRPLADRHRTERAAAQFQAVALLQRLPMKAELLQAGGTWRAVFWPFRSAEDAEKVRLALADKGLSTEVIEF